MLQILAAPGSRCTLPGGTGTYDYADTTGHLNLYVSATSAAQPKVSVTIPCTSGAATSSYPVTYELGAAGSTGISASAHAALQPTSTQISTAIAKLGFDPRTASDAQLQSADLPMRPNLPSSSSEFQNWLQAAVSPTTEVIRQGVPTDFTSGGPPPTGIRLSPACEGCNENTQAQFIYAGFIGSAPTAGTYTVTNGAWNVMTAAATMPPNVYGIEEWVGLDATASVFQTGTLTYVTQYSGYQTVSAHAWYEWYNGGISQYQLQTEAFSVGPGESIGAQCFVFTASNGQKAIEWWIKDYNSGALFARALWLSSGNYHGLSADWIAERLQVQQGSAEYYYRIPDFGTNVVSSAWATAGGYSYGFYSLGGVPGGSLSNYSMTPFGAQGIAAYTSNPQYGNSPSQNSQFTLNWQNY